MMKIKFMLLLILVSSSVHSQNNVKGILIDIEKNPLSYILVSITASENEMSSKSLFSSESGSFQFGEVKAGDYLLKCYLYGDSIYSMSISVKNETLDLDTLIIDIDKKVVLSEVTITASKPMFESKNDRIIVNVQNYISLKNGSVYEALTKSPGININKEKGIITLNGKNDVIVMLDGKLNRLPLNTLLQLLDGTPAESIEKIELISSPGANYDAGSSGGIINIVGLKQQNKGTNANLSLTGGHGGKERASAVFSINQSVNNFNFYSDVSYSRNHFDQKYYYDRNIFNEGIEHSSNTFSARDNIVDNYTAKIGIDFSSRDKLNLGVQLSGMYDTSKLKANSYTHNQRNGEEVSTIDVFTKERNDWSNYTIDFYLKRNLHERHAINFDATYYRYKNMNTAENKNMYYNPLSTASTDDIFHGKKTSPVHSGIFSIDYKYNYNKNQINLGLKTSLSYYESIIKSYSNIDENNNLSKSFDLNEEIYSSFINYIHAFSKHTNFQLGIRFEHFRLKSNGSAGRIERRSNDIFPSFFFSHYINENNKITFSYNKRVSRPAYNDFAPYYTFVDPTLSFSGNEHLTQSTVNLFKIDYKLKQTLLTLEYSNENDGIARFQPLVDFSSNTLKYTSINMEHKKTLAFLIAFPIKITKRLSLQNNFMSVYQSNKYQNLRFNNAYAKINTIIRFDLPWNLITELSGIYQTAQLIGISKNKNTGVLNLAVEKKVTNVDRIRLSLTNILSSYKDYDIVDKRELSYNFHAKYDYLPVTIRLTYTRSFGNDEIKANKRKNEIENRIK